MSASQRKWKATHRVSLETWTVPGEPIQIGEFMDALVMVVGRKGYQEDEWPEGSGDPDLVQDPGGDWTYEGERVRAKFVEV